MTQMLELSDNDFKAAIVAMLHEAKVTALETIEKI